jgi:hypothetical protein
VRRLREKAESVGGGGTHTARPNWENRSEDGGGDREAEARGKQVVAGGYAASEEPENDGICHRFIDSHHKGRANKRNEA